MNTVDHYELVDQYLDVSENEVGLHFYESQMHDIQK